jgi:hypothetical protein
MRTSNKNFWEELIAYFPLIRQGTTQKMKTIVGNTKTHRRQGDVIRFLTKIKGGYTGSWTDTDGCSDRQTDHLISSLNFFKRK